jgi:2-polyprenyl-3-methyl-5-hydroxy-6-metoxy-1,4-benzoquinol methylase
MRTVHIDFEKATELYHLLVAKLAVEHTYSGKVLDIGSGAGNILREVHLLKPSLDLYGADIHPNAQHKLEGIATKFFLLPENRFDLSVVGTGYQTCIMSHVLEHLQNPVEAVESALRILNPGGRLILAVPNPVNPANMIKAGLRRYQANEGHVMTWDRGHWLNFLHNIIKAEVLMVGGDEVFLFPRSTPVKSIRKAIEIGLSRIFPGWSFSSFAVIGK